MKTTFMTAGFVLAVLGATAGQAQTAAWNGEGLDPQTAAFIAEFAKQPPREDQSVEDLRAGYRQSLIDGSVTPDPAVVARDLVVAGAAGDMAARLIAASAGTRVMTIDYRRAPEATFPAARDDAVAAFRWVVEHAGELGADPNRIALAGESAGAAHAVSAALVLKTGEARPGLVWVMSPALDATMSGQSYDTFATGKGRTTAEFDYLWSLYVPDTAMRDDPEVSPALADLGGLPPLHVYPAEFDPAHDDGVSFATRAREAGVPVVLEVRRGLAHQYPEITGVSDASRQAVAGAAREAGAALAR